MSMQDVRNIAIGSGVGACPVQLPFNPKESKIRIIDNCNPNKLYNGVQTAAHISFTIEIDLVWGAPIFFDDAQYKTLRTLWLDRSPFYIYPNPLYAPEIAFKVQWLDNYNFESATGWLDGWGWFGIIKLVGAETIEDAATAQGLTAKQYLESWNFK